MPRKSGLKTKRIEAGEPLFILEGKFQNLPITPRQVLF